MLSPFPARLLPPRGCAALPGARAMLRRRRPAPVAAAPACRPQAPLHGGLHASTCPPPPPHPRHLLTLADLSREEILRLVSSASAFKRLVRSGAGAEPALPLRGRTVTMLFSKRSTRTRMATETAASWLGARGIYLGLEEKQNETVPDMTRVVSSMTDGIMARVNGHADLETMVRHSAVPVINALSDKYHPTQILADLLTLHEVYGGRPGPAGVESSSSSSPPPAFFFGRNLRVAWVGDANNVLNELMVALPKVGINLRVATPEKYPVQGDVLEIARADAAAQGTQVTVCHDPREAVDGADVIVTDTWISMGQESEKAQRLADFTGFRVCEDLARRGGAKEDWKFMHCLPRKQEEVDDQVFYSDRSLVFQEAENRKWTILAVLDALLVRGEF